MITKLASRVSVAFAVGLMSLAGAATHSTNARASTLYFYYFTSGTAKVNADLTLDAGSGFVLAGSVSGTLEVNNNIFDVTTINTFGYVSGAHASVANIPAYTSGFSPSSETSYYNAVSGVSGPIMTLDGSDLALVFFEGNQPSRIVNHATFNGWSVDGLGGGSVVPAGWLTSLDAPLPVPEPSSLALLGAGLLGLGFTRRLRAGR